jgi:hypothetical protein
VDDYETVFKDGGGSFWGAGWDREGSVDGTQLATHTGKNCRILALCFMAAMVEAGDA